MPEIREAMRDGFRRLVELVAARVRRRRRGGPGRFFAQGMLLNVLGAIDADEVDAPWARLLLGRRLLLPTLSFFDHAMSDHSHTKESNG